MATNNNNTVILMGICLSILTFSTASSLFQDLIGEIDGCEDVCQKTYPAHTYEKNLSEDCCKRGCRLYSIIELVGDQYGVNGTLMACYDNCKDAYPNLEDESAACFAGCKSQKPFADKFEALPGLESPFMDDVPRMMYPLLYMHNMYSNVVDKVRQHMSVSWSFFMQDGTGRLVVIKTQPQALDMQDIQNFDEDSSHQWMSSIAAETNIEPVERTATEMLRHSQIKSARAFGDNEINVAETDPWRLKLKNDELPTDWLTCIARKTGIPRLFLCVLILLSAISMIWLCMSAAVGMPESKPAVNLSIKSMDMQYLRSLPEKKGLKGVYPQDFVEARPLPVKIRIENI